MVEGVPMSSQDSARAVLRILAVWVVTALLAVLWCVDARAAVPAGYTVVVHGSSGGDAGPSFVCAPGSLVYTEWVTWGAAESGMKNCPVSGTGHCDYTFQGAFGNGGTSNTLCASEPLEPAPPGGGASAAQFDWGNSAHVGQAVLAVLLCGLFFHGYAMGARE